MPGVDGTWGAVPNSPVDASFEVVERPKRDGDVAVPWVPPSKGPA